MIVVPSRILLHQWKDEARSFFGNEVSLLLAGDAYDQWKSGSVLRDHLIEFTDVPPVVLSTIDTASSERFVDRLEGIERIFLVADEVHRAGSPERQRLLDIDADWRLGLSATWEREGDVGGTDAIESYFGGVVPPVYTLADAVRDGHLSEYRYFVHTVSLDDAEREEWETLRARIGRAIAQAGGDIAENVRQLLIARARIVKCPHAQSRISPAQVLQDHYEDGHAWLVYCDNQHQVGAVRQACEALGVRAQEYRTDGGRQPSGASRTRPGGRDPRGDQHA